MSDERDATYYQESHEEVARLEARERAAYAIKPWNEQDDEEVNLWREHRVWER